MSFKGRMGSGLPGGREPYLDASLRTRGGDWEKHLYSYRLWGRLLYDPNESPETWRRFLGKEFGPASQDCEAALAHASRVLPLVTTAHLPSASNNRFWPEVYTDMPIVDARRAHPYGDTPSPRRFGSVSALDPALFSRIEEFAADVVQQRPSARYSAADVARWLDSLASTAEQHLAGAERFAKPDAAAFRRLAVDVRVQAGLARFFAAKLRAALGHALYERTRELAALQEAMRHYRAARAAWQGLVKATEGVYRKDLAFGRDAWLRGHWADRMAAIDADLAEMEKMLLSATDASGNGPASLAAVLAATAPRQRPRCEHQPPDSFRRGEPVAIEIAIDLETRPSQVLLHYRRVNQGEEYRVETMSGAAGRYRATVPGSYTDSPYPLLYFFELAGARDASLYPGLADDLSNQPYFVLRQARKLS